MRRRRWSDRGTAVATATSLHIVVVLLIGFASPRLLLPPRQEPEAETVVEVELSPQIFRPPVETRPLKVHHPEPTPTAVARATPAPAPPQAAPKPQAPPEAKPAPRPVLPPSPAPVRAEAPRAAPAPPAAPVREAQKEPEKDKDKEKEKDRPREVRQAEAPRPAPLPPAPSSPAPAAAARSAPAPDFRLPPGYGRQSDEAGGGLKGVLRATVGCAHEDFAHLTAAEREHCLSAFARDAGHGLAVDAVPADKRAAYDVEAAANARRRANKTGPLVAPVVACDGPGSNLGGGCLPADSHVTVKPQ